MAGCVGNNENRGRNMRQIVLDTETTGISPKQGHRIIEIGCVELQNRRLTGNHYHVYIDPQRQVDPGAFRVHGISNDFLQGKALFKDVIDDFISYVDGAELIIHNAPFDVGFINHEFALLSKSLGKIDKLCKITDTLAMARKMHPGQKNNLDALCKRYFVDNSDRDLHGALIDADILALVYLAMTGGQDNLFEDDSLDNSVAAHSKEVADCAAQERAPLSVIVATAEEERQHKEMLEQMQQASKQKPLWDDER